MSPQFKAHTCQHCRGKSKNSRLHCHHIVFISNQGTDSPEKLITLCGNCPKTLHNGEFKLSGSRSKTKHTTEILRKQIKNKTYN
ncbi:MULTISPECIES: HNH endonuclease [unclassified Methanosarcina]|uniref:HNH endonuclease n=1 Tax=unclassified Methanosarcina TaxID=2644672 RepID=UPI0009E41181|nr:MULTISPECIES: HNH endonuclease [unclassified Methanosarcina]